MDYFNGNFFLKLKLGALKIVISNSFVMTMAYKCSSLSGLSNILLEWINKNKEVNCENAILTVTCLKLTIRNIKNCIILSHSFN